VSHSRLPNQRAWTVFCGLNDGTTITFTKHQQSLLVTLRQCRAQLPTEVAVACRMQQSSLSCGQFVRDGNESLTFCYNQPGCGHDGTATSWLRAGNQGPVFVHCSGCIVQNACSFESVESPLPHLQGCSAFSKGIKNAEQSLSSTTIRNVTLRHPAKAEHKP